MNKDVIFYEQSFEIANLLQDYKKEKYIKIKTYLLISSQKKQNFTRQD